MPPTTEQNSVILKKLLNILFTGRRNNDLIYSLYNLGSTELKTHHPFGGFFLNQFTQQLKRISEAGEMAFISGIFGFIGRSIFVAQGDPSPNSDTQWDQSLDREHRGHSVLFVRFH